MDKLLTNKNAVPSSSMAEAIKLAPRARSASMVSSSSSSASKKKSTSLPNETVEYLKAWMMSPEHIAHPYPSELEKANIMEETGIELKQLTNWFVNNRKRYWKPRVEARLRDQQQDKKSTPPPSSPVAKSEERKLTLLDLALPKNTDLAAAITRSPSKRRATVSATSSPIRAVVSAQNSVASDSFTSSDDDDEDDSVRSETIDIHILQPSTDGPPELADVSVLQNIPSERILRTFYNCALTYSKSRDSEIVRMKKHYLAVFLATHKKRTAEEAAPAVVTPRSKFRRVSVDLWKEACQSAEHVYDNQLPSLEEAARLFGYAV